MLSVIIPSRNQPTWQFTQKTVTDLFEKATGDIEVIVVMDGYQLDPPLKSHKKLIVIHNPESKGMRPAINAAAAVAKGKYIMKVDDHCMFGESYDEILAADCSYDTLAVPSRYALDGENWKRKYGPIDYLTLTYPFHLDNQFGFGMHGKKFLGERGFTGGYFEKEKKLKHILIDDMLTCQGSCWFMPKKLFEAIGGMQHKGYLDHQEAQEMCFKVWLSGGRCIINKRTWYAHLHKGNQHGRGYRLFTHHLVKSQIYSTDIWMNNKWSGQVRPLKWLIERENWWPLEMWPDDWDNPERWKNYDYSIWHKAREIQVKAGSAFVYANDVVKYAKEIV